MTWGLKIPSTPYSAKTKANIVDNLLPKAREIFSKEYSHALENCHWYQLVRGRRFYDDSTILWSLESNFSEEEFNKNSAHCLNEILRGACGTDYYYTYEKEW